jgi:LDH2 family malate/lactate/ureidoglycolate dehydrogenase
MYQISILKEFTQALFQKIGCTPADAQIIADVLIRAELRGIPSHGLLRIPDYIMLYESGRINPAPGIKIIHETPSTAVVDGDSAFGMIAAKRSMQIAIKKAENVGTGWVSTRNSNHFGIAGYYAMMALEHNMIGIVMTNANPLVAPTFSVSKLLGTNPIAVAIPAGKEPPFVADFATTPIARGKLEIFSKKGKNAPLGYVQDKDGNPVTDPDILKKGGAMLTLGGDYEHGSHKGYCMSAIVDIFSAVLSGANFGPFVPPSVAYLPVLENSPGEGTGHFFGAMRIDAFRPAGEFREYMDQWITTFRNGQPSAGHDQVIIPGDPERELEIINAEKGIELIPAVENEIKQIAEKYNIPYL